MAALDGAVPHSGSPGISEVIGDDLNFHVARIGYQSFEKNSGISECLEGFGAGRFESFEELAFGADLADAMPTPSSGGFNQQGISETLGMAHGVIQRFHSTAAPR